MKRPPKAFTLVEMALILLLFGVLLATVLPRLLSDIKTDKTREGKASVSEAREELIGYALVNTMLPAADVTGTVPAVPGSIKARQDTWGQGLTYVLPNANATGQTLADTSLCDFDGTTLSYTDPAGKTTVDVAFIVASKGLNAMNDLAGIGTGTVTARSFGADSAVNAGLEFDDVAEFVTLDYIKSRMDCSGSGPGPGPGPGSGSDIAFANGMDDFDVAGVANPPGQTGPNPVVVIDDGALTVALGGVNNNDAGCLWYQGTDAALGCAAGACTLNYGFRAFFTVRFSQTDTSADSSAARSGITFAIIDALANDSQACGSTADYLGYGSQGARTISAESMALELDVYSNGVSGPAPQRVDSNMAYNHAALVFWDSSSDSSVRHVDVNGGLAGDFNPAYPSTAIAMPSTSRSPNWLENGASHNVRIEVYRNAGAGAAGGTFNATAWIDCLSCDDLTLPYATQAGDVVVQLNATVGTNSTSSPPYTGSFDTFRFGWTVGTPGGSSQLATISDFAIKLLPGAPAHAY
ncbi:hypothetical protein [Desulfocurvus vexinensis]|uniref:hypothetical protein n=1 Tax=Desulfocurvus vexinensis TaxID=399548 RepID=UPI0004919FAD|nr:hypothetical protein [Desulfocurvus vexinensis]